MKCKRDLFQMKRNSAQEHQQWKWTNTETSKHKNRIVTCTLGQFLDKQLCGTYPNYRPKRGYKCRRKSVSDVNSEEIKLGDLDRATAWWLANEPNKWEHTHGSA